MTIVHDAELMTAGPDEAVVTFRTDGEEPVATRIGDTQVTTTGPYHHARVGGLEPGTEYRLDVEGSAPSDWLPTSFVTLERPAGR
ncbi:MAG TPA: fibronectin type III domain-containing protein, partial [Acidimicrobiia bacterium]|nr:fibronectin type III domain-containing protein [Acidimicrobiia bacterium]